MGLLDYAKAQIGVWNFKRSPLGQALRAHTQQFFYSNDTLSWMSPENKLKHPQQLMTDLVNAQQAASPALALREKLAEYVIIFCQHTALCLKEGEKAGQSYAANPYISGKLHEHIVEAAKHNEELAEFIWKEGRNVSADELISVANTRSALCLYYANGLNMARIAIGDTDPDKDWYKPFVEAMLVWEEGTYRQKLGLPQLVSGLVGTLPYSTYLNYVVDGELNPFYTWVKNWPDRYLAGEGPVPEVA